MWEFFQLHKYLVSIVSMSFFFCVLRGNSKFAINHLIMLSASCPCESVSESRSVVSDSLRPHGLCSPWHSPGKNTGLGSLSLLQGIFPTQGLNPGLLHCRRLAHEERIFRNLILIASIFIHLEKEMASHPSIFAEESHGQKSLAGYSPWGRTESAMTEQLTTHSFIKLSD